MASRRKSSSRLLEINNNCDDSAGKALTQAHQSGLVVGGDNIGAKESKSDTEPSRSSSQDSGAKQSERQCQDSGYSQAGRGQCSGATGGQQRQMFSLKQLALNSRNLTIRKRNSQEQESLPTKAGGLQAAKAAPSDVLTGVELSIGSSGDNSCVSDAEQQALANLQANSTRDESGCEPDGSSSSAIEPTGRDDTGDDEENLVVEAYASSRDDALNSDEEDDDDDSDQDQDEDDHDDTDESMSSDDVKAKGRLRLGRRKRQQLSRRRRSSCCPCEPIVSRLDPADGLPVTDVDLVTYKDLCQLEQQSLHMRTNQRRQRISAGQHHLDQLESHRQELGGQSGRVRQPAVVSSIQLRRASLQEESSAYYQLCTSNEEQTIRQRYIWYPPSLSQLALVDEFFSSFPREKVPLVGQSNSSANAGSVCGRHPAASTSSYRDEQISLQLPRQDISLDYCSYPMNELSRSTYLQFVDKRNSQALDVGLVVQVRPNHLLLGSFGSQEGVRKPARSGCPTPDRGRAMQQRLRKLSTVSQTAVTLLTLSQSQRDQLAGQQQVGGAGAQRCRRCLVRFEDQQLAVAAPNFIIGSTLYRAQVGAAVPVNAPACAELAYRSGCQGAPLNVALFHPTCFTCSTCKEFLVDLVYCLRDNKLYCVRHYGESLRPRCSWCQEVSIDGAGVERALS